jgi:hypothetical protein
MGALTKLKSCGILIDKEARYHIPAASEALSSRCQASPEPAAARRRPVAQADWHIPAAVRPELAPGQRDRRGGPSLFITVSATLCHNPIPERRHTSMENQPGATGSIIPAKR